MQRLANISDYQEIVFGDPENSCLLNFQNTDNQYRYSHKITPNYTGKELDAETGYSYFGARYLDHTLITAWLSVDPMADKYPSLSPYAYCAWNPVKLVDPDECEIGDYYDIKGNYLGWDGKNDNYEMSRPVVDKIIGQQSIRTQREIKILIQNFW